MINFDLILIKRSKLHQKRSTLIENKSNLNWKRNHWLKLLLESVSYPNRWSNPDGLECKSSTIRFVDPHRWPLHLTTSSSFVLYIKKIIFTTKTSKSIQVNPNVSKNSEIHSHVRENKTRCLVLSLKLHVMFKVLNT